MSGMLGTGAGPVRIESPAREARSGPMPVTSWTIVLTARNGERKAARAALADLCKVYWRPLYVFVRRQGHEHHEAEDLTQGFFEHLLERDWLAGVDRSRGKFRSFLLSALSNHLHNERERIGALKRGGGVREFVSWERDRAQETEGDGERRAGWREPALEPQQVLEFDRLWACALVEKALAGLEEEYRRCGKAGLFAALSPFMTRTMPAGVYADLADRLKMSEGALRIAMHRLVQRFGERLRNDVAQTVANPDTVNEELREVLRAWAGAAPG